MSYGKGSGKTREFRAEAKFQRTSPQKAKLVLDLIKGKRVEQALEHGALHQEAHGSAGGEGAAARRWPTRSYVSDERGLDLDIDNLYVKTRSPTKARA